MATAASEITTVLPELDGVMGQWLRDHPVNKDDRVLAREMLDNATPSAEIKKLVPFVENESAAPETVFDAILKDSKARESLPIVDLVVENQRLDDEADAETLEDSMNSAAAGPGPDRSVIERPSQVWIGAHLYSIDYDHDEMMRHCGERHKDLLGVSNHHNLYILIDDGVAEQLIRDVLWHEIMHCIWAESGTNELSNMSEEEIVSVLTPRIVSMMRVNPDVMSYMLYSTDAR